MAKPPALRPSAPRHPIDLTPERLARHAAPRRPSRIGKRNVTGYFPPDVARQLRQLAAERDTTIQRLLAEALNDLFAKYGKAEIAPVD